MAELADLERALVNADAAGDTEAATALAGEIKRVRGEPRTVAGDVARQVGLTARAGVKGVLGIPAMVGDAAFSLSNLVQRAFGAEDLPAPGRTTRALDALLNKFLPEPQTPVERVSGDVAGALAGMGSMARTAQSLTPTSAMGQYVANQFASNVPTQALSSAAASGAAGVTREAGGGPAAQLMTGLLAGVAAPMAGQAVRNQLGPAQLARSLQNSEQTPFAREGARLKQETGIELTPGAETGNRFMTSMENTARRYAPTADRVQDIDVKIANQAISRVNSLADKISTNAMDPEQVGSQIQTTIQTAAKRLDAARDSLAKQDYGLVREIAGDGKVVRLQGFADELGKIIEQFKNVAGTDAQKVTAQARAALNRITGVVQEGVPDRVIEAPAGNIRLYGTKEVTGTLDNTIDEAMRTRSFFGKAAKGSANVFDDIAPDLQRSLAARLFRAINDDFDAAAQNASGALRQALDKANSRYRASSQSIEFLEKSALGKMIGEDLADSALSGAKTNTTSGEQIATRLQGMHPSVRKTSMGIISQWNPTLATNIRAQFLRDALDQGMAIPPSVRGASQVPISFNRFLSALGSEKVGFQRNLESYGFQPDEIKDIRDVAAAMLRQGDRSGTNFSNTEVTRQNMEVSEAIGDAAMATATGGFSGLVRGGIGKAITLAGKRIGMNRIVDAMASTEGRKALKTLSDPKASPQAIAAAFATVEENTQPQ